MPTACPTPPTAFRVKRTREVDVHARNLDAWDQDYVQTSPGVFQGQVRELFDGPLQAFEEVANCATSQHCRPWRGGVWLGLSVPERPEGLRFMGRPVGGHELMISDGSEAFDLQVPAGHGLYGLVFDPAELQASYWKLYERLFSWRGIWHRLSRNRARLGAYMRAFVAGVNLHYRNHIGRRICPGIV